MNFDAAAQTLFRLLLVPGRWLMEQLGLHPADMQVWALIVAIFMLVLALAANYGDLVLARRRATAQGTVVSIDRDDFDTPRIAFIDERGKAYEFNSPLPVNSFTDAVGKRVTIVYDPRRPQRAREAGRPIVKGFSMLVWHGVAIAFLAYAIAGATLA